MSLQRKSTLALGNESQEELDCMQRRDLMRHEVSYAQAVHRLWSIFAKDSSGHVHKQGYLDGLSRFCQVLMPHLPTSEALQLATNDWNEDVGHFSTDGSTLDFDGFYLAMSELTDLWCPVTDADEYAAFIDSLFKRASVRVVHDAAGSVLRRDLVRSEYVFIEDAPLLLVGDEKEIGTASEGTMEEATVEEKTQASIKMQAIQRGRSSRKTARTKWLSGLSEKFNPANFDLRRAITKQKEKAAAKMQSIQRGRVGRKKAAKHAQTVEKQQQDKAAQRMQAVTRGRNARELVRQKKIRKQYANLIPQGMDLRRPSSKKIAQAEEQTKSALMMQSLARKRNARVAVQEKRDQRNAAVSMQNVQRGRMARKRVDKIREEKQKKEQVSKQTSPTSPTSPTTPITPIVPSSPNVSSSLVLDLRRPSSKKKDALQRFETKEGTFHEIVDYDNEATDSAMISYEWATVKEIVSMQEQSESARPPLLLEGQSISPMWENPSGEHFAEHDHPLIQGRHHAHLRQIQQESVREAEAEEAAAAATAAAAELATKNVPPAPIDPAAMAAKLNPLGLDLRRPQSKRRVAKPHHHVNRFRAVARSIGRLTSLKQFALERHVVLYGTNAKNGTLANNGTSNATSSNTNTITPEAAEISDATHRTPAADAAASSSIQTEARKRFTLGMDPMDEDGLDLSRALRTNDATCTIGTQRGVWVVGVAEDACERVTMHASRLLTLDPITPSLVLQNAIKAAKKDAIERARKKEEEGDVEEEVVAETETEEDPDAEPVDPAIAIAAKQKKKEEEEAAAFANVSALVLVGRKLLNGTSVTQQETDDLMQTNIVETSLRGQRGYALTGYPRTIEQSNALSAALSCTFSPSEIIVLDMSDVASYTLRQSKLKVDLTTGTITSETDRTAFTTFIQNNRQSILDTARNEKIAELQEENADVELEEGETAPDYTTFTFDQLGIDIEALELPTLPTGSELVGGDYPVTLPLDGNATLTTARAQNHLLIPLSTPLEELQNSTMHRIDATQPMDDILTEVSLRTSGGWTSTAGIGRSGCCIPSMAVAFPTLPVELEHPALEEEEEAEEEEEPAAEEEPTEDGTAPPVAVETKPKEKVIPSNPPLTEDQMKYLLHSDVQVEAPPQDDEEEAKEEENVGLIGIESVGTFLTATDGLGTESVAPPLRRFGWYRSYCPVTLVDEGKLEYGRPECSVMVGGKVYVMANAEKCSTFLTASQKYIASRPKVPKSRTVCIISAPYTNNAASIAAEAVAKRFGLRSIIAKDSVASIATEANGVASEALVNHMMSRCNAQKSGWVMEGCPLHSGHVAGLIEAGWKPDVVVVCGPSTAAAPEPMEDTEGGEEGSDTTATTKTDPTVTTLDPSSGLFTYEEDYPTLIETLRTANITVVEINACSETYGIGNIQDMTGWLAQTVHPMLLRCDSILPPDDVSAETHISLSSTTGPICPVALKNVNTCARGKEEITSYVDGAKYTFCDERAKNQFDASPETYIVKKKNASPPPMRVMVVAPVGSSRSEILQDVANASNIPLVSIGGDSEYVSFVQNAMRPLPPIVNEEGDEEEQPAPEMPAPETFVLPILKRLLTSTWMSEGCIIDGDPSIFTPAVCEWMVKERLHPSTVIYCTMDAQLATDRRVPNEFTWSPPVPEPIDEEDEDAEPPVKLTKEELLEMEEAAKSEIAAKILEEEETSIVACDATVESFVALGVPETTPRPSISVGLRLARRRIASTVSKHGVSLRQETTMGSVHALSVSTDAETTPEDMEAACEMSLQAARTLLASGYREMSRYVTRDPVVYFTSQGTQEGAINQLGYACVHQHCIYFCDNETNRTLFIADPTKYLQNIAAPSHATPFPTVHTPSTVCVVGGPMSGKTTLCVSLSKETGAIHLTPENLLKWAMLPSNVAASPACASACNQLTSGDTVASPRTSNLSDGTVLLGVLKARVQRLDCIRSGWILDGFPQCAADARALVASGVAPTVILSLEGLSHIETMVRARTVHTERQIAESLDRSASTSSVAERLQIWIHESESMKATLSQAYLNTKRVQVSNNGNASSKWAVLSNARDVLSASARKNAAHATALSLHVPAPLDGVPLLSNDLMSKRGHLGGYCPVQLLSENKLIPTGHGSLNQRRFGTIYRGRVYSCANLEALNKLSSNPNTYISSRPGPTSKLPSDLPLMVPLGAHLRSGASLEVEFGGYCPVTFQEGQGARDWSSIVEADPICCVQYQNKMWGFANSIQKRKFMEQPYLYVTLELPLKLPPKMKPVSLSQLKNGGLHGVLAVAEQSLSVATQDALLALGNNRIKFPSLNVAESAAKFIGLYLKSQNPSSKKEVRDRYAAKLQEFINECELATYLKDNQEILNTSTPRGSGVRAVRGMSSSQKGKVDEYMNKARKFELLCGEKGEQLYERFMNP